MRFNIYEDGMKKGHLDFMTMSFNDFEIILEMKIYFSM